MTEYDYSGDAYERYLTTQQRISRWTEETSHYRPSDPFIASPASEASHSAFGSPSRSSSSRGPQTSGTRHFQTRHRSTFDAMHRSPEPSSSNRASTSTQRSSAEYSHSPSRSRPTYKDAPRSRTSRRASGSSRGHATASTIKTVIPNNDSPTYIKRPKSQFVLVPIDVSRYVMVLPWNTRLEVLVSTYLLLLSALAWWITSDVGIHDDWGQPPHTTIR